MVVREIVGFLPRDRIGARLKGADIPGKQIQRSRLKGPAGAMSQIDRVAE
jgi:hypothetical protein